MARAREAAPNGPEQYAVRSALIERFLLKATRGYPIRRRVVEYVAERVRLSLLEMAGLTLSTRTIRRHAERLGLIAEHNARR